MPKPTQPDAVERVKVTVKADGHRHGGKPVKPGETIEVLPRQAEALAKRGIIEAVK